MLLNLFLFMAVAVQAVIYWRQLRVMRKQAESLNNQSEVMRAQLEAMKEQATVMQRQLDAMAVTERAYVVIETPRIGPVEIPTISITADVMNAGRTPAFNLTTKTQTQLFRPGDKLTGPTDWKGWPEDRPSNMLAAGARMTIAFTPLDVTPEVADFLISGHTRVFIDAQFRYTDLTNKQHILQIGYAIEFEDNEGYAVLLYEQRQEEQPPAKNDKHNPSGNTFLGQTSCF